MIEEVSSIFWGLSLAINIILLLIGLPLCLLICCCCRKHQNALEKDVVSFIHNHNLVGNQSHNQPQLTYQENQPILQNQGNQPNIEVQQKVQESKGNLSSQDPVLNQHEIRKRAHPQIDQVFDNDELME